MAKSEVTASEKLMITGITQVREQANHKLSASVSIANKDCQIAGNYEETEDEISGASNKTENVAALNIYKPEDSLNGEEMESDDKSEYDVDSFCSDISCKESEVTNVTPHSSMSGCSSLLHSMDVNYIKRNLDVIRTRNGGDWHRDGKEDEDLSLSESEMTYLGKGEGTVILEQQRRQLIRCGRRNMSFTNEDLRKIERENQLLLRKIMSHQKPQGKTVKPISGPPRTSSSAINRKRQQKKIEEDNMMLLRRIQQAKSCAMPRTSVPGCKLTML
ncbi:cilia- and flagella-associated protein 97 isoform X1 [Neodiprion pinetum]|uniref:cilia- and flagella-associated protein 97 isoform X1 n=1 Tax=Neodiprion pinetum TaxID=441929 RepID=UPI001EDCF748|nr:cilia- and flagella-associated protein 97 isoform X1 [Neodiprion pinetum]XP_046488409.1 cilia- and flagella-associated protein 97 isoform X1 [Neodiprion pinetum]